MGMNIREKAMTLLEDSNLIAQTQSEKRSEKIAALFGLRKRAMRLVKNAERTLKIRRDDLKIINKTICEAQGHTLTNWKINDDILDRSWYYTRECTICGVVERSENEPPEFQEQQKQRKAREGIARTGH